MPDERDQPIDDRIRAGLAAENSAALELIWDAHAKGLLACLTGLLTARADAEDALQAVFVKIAQNRTRVAEARNLKAYLFGMARHEALSALKRRARQERPAADPAWLEAAPESEPAPGRAEAVSAALARLPEKQRTVIVMHLFAEHTFQEIADRLGLSLNTTASRYRYGLEKLRHWLREEWP